MITKCYTISLVEFLFDVNGDVNKDIWCARFPSSAGRRPRVTHSRERRGLLGSKWPEKDGENSGFWLLSYWWQLITRNLRSCETVSTFSVLSRGQVCHLGHQVHFPFLDTCTHFLLRDWPIVDRCKLHCLFWAPQARSTRFQQNYSAVGGDPLHLFVLNYFTVRKRKYNFSTSFHT